MMERRRVLLQILCASSLAIVGCGHVTPVAGLDKDVTAWKPALPAIAVGSKLGGSSLKSHVQALIDKTREIIKSSEFRRHLQGYSDLHIGPFEAASDGTTTLATYLGMRSSPRGVPVWVLGYKDGGSEVARTGICQGDNGNFAELYIGKLTIGRWLRSSLRSKSCAINTMAHELTHTIPVMNGTVAQLYKDKWYQVAAFFGQEPVSYGVGAIAQCTYLEREQALAPLSFEDCLGRYGTDRFRPVDCDKAETAGGPAVSESDFAEANTYCKMGKPPQATP